MSRYKLYVEYEGTRYSGWQAQKEARTVQGEIITAVEKALNTNEFELYGSGRTDGGVHALMQVAHLDAPTNIEPFKLRIQINDALPADIHIIDIQKAGAQFHARHDAIARSYLYQISRRRSAFGKRFVWWIKDELNVQKMQEAAKLFIGLKDFISFAADESESKSSKVMIEEIQIKENGSLILIRIVGSHFLHKMVRQMVGVIAEVGRGQMTSKDIQQFLQSRSDVPARFTAPPSGLFLERVYYRGDKRLEVQEPVLKIE